MIANPDAPDTPGIDGAPPTRPSRVMETYAIVLEDKKKKIDAEAKAFLLQLKLEWQRFVTIVKQNQDLKTVTYHKLYDILKQHQNEVNKKRVERLARTANPLALVAATQQPV
ncbi:hypothetical protein Tco_0196561 [Tanacetum coccineum]